MSEGNNQARLFRFGMFELDSDAGELRKDGKSRPRIRDQALQILIMLLEKSDEVVSPGRTCGSGCGLRTRLSTLIMD